MRSLGFHIELDRKPADWSLGRGAGYKRNAEMVKLRTDICLAFIMNESNGSSHTANLAKKAGIQTLIFEE
jgi:hypothetical protein